MLFSEALNHVIIIIIMNDITLVYVYTVPFISVYAVFSPDDSAPHHHACFVSQFQEQLRGYSQLYDLSRSERSKVQELAVTMATDGHALESIGQLLSVAVNPLDLSVKTVLHDAVVRVVAALRYE